MIKKRILQFLYFHNYDQQNPQNGVKTGLKKAYGAYFLTYNNLFRLLRDCGILLIEHFLKYYTFIKTRSLTNQHSRIKDGFYVQILLQTIYISMHDYINCPPEIAVVCNKNLKI